MGEGMAIGLEALGAKAIIGTQMARLLGGIKSKKLSRSDGLLEFGFDRMYHVDGRFREDYIPNILLESADCDQQGDDVGLQTAKQVLTR